MFALLNILRGQKGHLNRNKKHKYPGVNIRIGEYMSQFLIENTVRKGVTHHFVDDSISSRQRWR